MLSRWLMLIGVFGVMVTITLPKLYKMAQIKGLLPGAVAVQRVIVEKWHQTPAEHHKGRNVYWIAIAPGDIRQRGSHRLNVVPEHWNRLNQGDTIELLSIPGDPDFYLRDGIFASWGNFVFDFVLIGVECIVVVTLFRRLRSQT